MSGALIWIAIIIWAVLFLLIRETFKIGGNPIFTFLIMIGMFFLVLFFVRIGTLRLRVWWANLKRGIAKIIHKG
jgi:hypothetical protein